MSSRKSRWVGMAASCVMVGALAIAASAGAGVPGTAGAAAATSTFQERQFADEIIRRLRRLGLNFNRGRLVRPYDPAGELC